MDKCIPWNPVPAEANLYFGLRVENLVERGIGGHPAVTLRVSTEHSDGAATYSVTVQWKVTFKHVAAYRLNLIERSPSAPPLPRPDDRDIAAFEVSPSSWLDMYVPHPIRRNVHHYVVLSEYEVYEIAAEGWSSELMPDDWNGLDV